MTDADNIVVAIRVRPLNKRELSNGDEEAWMVQDRAISQINPQTGKTMNQSYSFDHIFDTDAETKAIYSQIAKPAVTSSMNGFNSTIFAYGQTSSGKTFTMRGKKKCPGIIPLAVQDVFDYIEQTPDREFLLRVSYMEIYNEVITDLLKPGSTNLKVHNDATRGVFVGGLEEEIVTTPAQVMGLMDRGDANRKVGKTNMNETSSRSHSIFRMVIESREQEEQQTKKHPQRKSLDGAVKVSLLTLVDLAGSERASATGAEGVRLKEGSHINRSLLTLGTVISKLADPHQAKELGAERLFSSHGLRAHIPYRDSKLTRILQPSLGGNARTTIICTVTPAAFFADETSSTLKFASRAKAVQNKAIVNEVLDDQSLMKKYRKQIREYEEAQKAMAEENQEMKDRLNERDSSIAKLRDFIVTATTVSATNVQKPKKRHRETWCPGELSGMDFLVSSGSAGDVSFSSFGPSEPIAPLPLSSETERVEVLHDTITEAPDDSFIPDDALMERIEELEKENERLARLASIASDVVADEDVQAIMEERDELHDQCIELLNKVNEQQQVVAMADELQESLTAENEALERQLKDVLENNEQFDAHVQALNGETKNQLVEYEEEFQQLRREMEVLETTNRKHVARVAQFEAEAADKESALERIQELEMELQKIQWDRDVVERERDQLKEEHTSLKQELESKKDLETHSALQDEYSVVCQQVEEYQAQQSKMETAYTDSIAEHQQRIEQLEGEVNDAHDAIEEQRAIAEAELNRAADTLEEMQATLKFLETENDAIRQELEDRDRNCRRLTGEVRRMSTMPRNSVAMKKDIRSESHREHLFNKERDQAARHQQTMQRKLDAAQEKLKQVMKERTNLIQQKASIERENKKYQRQVEVLEKERSKNDTVVVKLRETTACLDKKEKRLDASEKRAETLERKCGEYELQLDQFREMIKANEKDMRSLQSTIEALEQEIRQRQEVCHSQEQKIHELCLDREELSAALDERQHLCEEQHAALKEHRQAIGELEQTLEAAREQHQQELHSSACEYEEMMAVHKEEKQAFESHIASLNADISGLQKNVSDLQASLNKENVACASLNAELTSTAEQLLEHQQQLTDEKAAVREMQTALNEIQAKLNQAQAETTDLHFQMEEEKAEWELTESSLKSSIATLEEHLECAREDRESMQMTFEGERGEWASEQQTYIEEASVLREQIAKMQETMREEGETHQEEVARLEGEIANVQDELDAANMKMTQMELEFEIKEQDMKEEATEKEAEFQAQQREWKMKEEQLNENVEELQEELKIRDQDLELKEAEREATELHFHSQIDDLRDIQRQLQQEMTEYRQQQTEKYSMLQQELQTKEQEWVAKRQKYLTMMKEKKREWATMEEARRENQQRLVKQTNSLKVEWANQLHQLQCECDEKTEQLKKVTTSHSELKKQVQRFMKKHKGSRLESAKSDGAIAPSTPSVSAHAHSHTAPVPQTPLSDMDTNVAAATPASVKEKLARLRTSTSKRRSTSRTSLVSSCPSLDAPTVDGE